MSRSEDSPTKEKAINRRRLYDKLSSVVVTSGGVAIILSIIAMLLFIGIEIVPLWQKPHASLINQFSVNSSLGTSGKDEILLVGTEEYQEIAFVFDKEGTARFVRLDDGSLISRENIITSEVGRVSSVYAVETNKHYAAATDKGWIIPFQIKYNVTFDDEGIRRIRPRIVKFSPINVADGKVKKFAFKKRDFEDSKGSYVAAFLTDANEFKVQSVEVPEDDFFGSSQSVMSLVDLSDEVDPGLITEIEVDSFLNNLYVGTSDGQILGWSIEDKNSPVLRKKITATSSPEIGVSSLGFLIGSRSIVVGTTEGDVSVWFPVRGKEGEEILTKAHILPGMDEGISGFSKSVRDRGFIASDRNGNVGIYHATSNTLQASLKGSGKNYISITFSPRADGIVAVDAQGGITHWTVDNPHPETNFRTLFGKVWYEGYSESSYVWQSTGGTDEFETKLSLTPLIYGTLKGAFYALLFAIPLAVLSAICVSQFMHPTYRNAVKPVVEVMAALPSVVLGFFAGLWMAPKIEKIFPAVMAMFIIIPVFSIISVYAWSKLPVRFIKNLRLGTQLFFLVPVIIGAVFLCLEFNSTLERALFAGDYKAWFYNVMGLQYDQRNSLVVGFAMAFAVIPIIFTISEDALSSVPKTLTSGSLALGASRWQTAVRIVLPSASPGIFSAVMIGLGRAVGETMIVLMATGNTPVMDWSFFNGFRALSANIAVELPEAPHGGTLYRVLFLAAMLLFLFTFVLNTFAEMIRQRLRKKYGQL